MLRTPFASERIQRIDPKTGVRVVQLTGYPLPSAHLRYDWPSITPDNRRVVFFSQRTARRDAPWDLFRVDSDGLNLFQLTERDCDRMEAGGRHGRPSAIMTLDGTTIYCVWSHQLCTVDVETGTVQELCSLSPPCPEDAPIVRTCLSADGCLLFATYRHGDRFGGVRVDLATGTATGIDMGGRIIACDPTGPRLVVTKGDASWGIVTTESGSRVLTKLSPRQGKWLVNEDGNDIEWFCDDAHAHATLLGRHLKIHATGLWPDKCIWICEKGKEPRRLVGDYYFWYSGASWDGEWIAADTNWPDDGLWLIHVPSGRSALVCRPEATQDHYEFGHPLPSLSQDGRLCLFRSDRTGVPQLYIAHIDDDLREQLRSGG
jgi:oligogalacturonide lyase